MPVSISNSTVAQILEREPDWALLPAGMPDAVHRVLRRALVKESTRRLRHIGDANLELDTADTGVSSRDTAPPLRRWPVVAVSVAAALVGAIIGAAAALVGAIIGAAALLRWQPSRADAVRPASTFTIAVTPLEVLPRAAAISPDGRYVAYIAGPHGNQKTYLRRVGDRQSRLIAELPLQSPQPFFSPDSQWVGFFDAGKLKKVAVGGGTPITLAEAPTPRGGSWGADGSIVFAPISRGGLMWVPSTGGPAQVLTTPDATRGKTSHRQPTFVAEYDTCSSWRRALGGLRARFTLFR